MSDESKKRRWSSRAWLLWTLAATMLLAYPLSIGPAYARFLNSADDPIAGIERMETIYAPIWWLHRHSEWAKAAIAWYLQRFI